MIFFFACLFVFFSLLFLSLVCLFDFVLNWLFQEPRKQCFTNWSSVIGKFCIPRRPWDEHDCQANAGQLVCKTKIFAESLENDRNLKTVRFQSLNFTSKPKGYLLQTTKLWEKLIVLNRRKEKTKEEVDFLSLKGVKFVKWHYFIPFNYRTS